MCYGCIYLNNISRVRSRRQWVRRYNKFWKDNWPLPSNCVKVRFITFQHHPKQPTKAMKSDLGLLGTPSHYIPHLEYLNWSRNDGTRLERLLLLLQCSRCVEMDWYIVRVRCGSEDDDDDGGKEKDGLELSIFSQNDAVFGLWLITIAVNHRF